ncbi:hypothetical protein GGR53DRAFT_466633 [Hypoxylon sp. FL1150]|nr:hypothetical protein GGR53DRAFT_466633 [Hypoxylon sp. FL1150]
MPEQRAAKRGASDANIPRPDPISKRARVDIEEVQSNITPVLNTGNTEDARMDAVLPTSISGIGSRLTLEELVMKYPSDMIEVLEDRGSVLTRWRDMSDDPAAKNAVYTVTHSAVEHAGGQFSECLGMYDYFLSGLEYDPETRKVRFIDKGNGGMVVKAKCQAGYNECCWWVDEDGLLFLEASDNHGTYRIHAQKQ